MYSKFVFLCLVLCIEKVWRACINAGCRTRDFKQVTWQHFFFFSATLEQAAINSQIFQVPSWRDSYKAHVHMTARHTHTRQTQSHMQPLVVRINLSGGACPPPSAPPLCSPSPPNLNYLDSICRWKLQLPLTLLCDSMVRAVPDGNLLWKKICLFYRETICSLHNYAQEKKKIVSKSCCWVRTTPGF